jgi:hypothetical protein
VAIIFNYSGNYMKVIYLALTILFLFTACSGEEDKNISEMESLKNEPHIAKVVEKINAKGYTYLQVTENKEDFWIAVPTLEIETGETVYFSKFMVMQDFKSETIDRTFDEILFVEDARKSPTPVEMKNIHSGASTVEKQEINLEPLKGERTIQQIFNDRSDLNGKLVKVKGKVIKFNQQIMKRNWIHIQDGTGKEDEFDLVITSSDKVEVGDIIIAEGKLATEKDFGAGYFFPVIIEDASITKEQ